jgi:hypothetical protein
LAILLIDYAYSRDSHALFSLPAFAALPYFGKWFSLPLVTNPVYESVVPEREEQDEAEAAAGSLKRWPAASDASAFELASGDVSLMN